MAPRIRAFLSIFFVCIIVSAQGQIPEGYYTNAEGIEGEELKSVLNDFIEGHTEYPYTSTSTDVWDILKESDRDTANPDNVILFYTGWSVDAAQEYNNASGWSREHVWAKSRGDFGTDKGAGTDAHHLRPCDISVNSARNNRWFDNCTEPHLDGGQETGCFTSSTSWVWQPRDEVKGDAARMIFYMATRYEGEDGELDLEVIDYLPDDNYTKDPIHAKLEALLEWHLEDPVDDFERNRNEVVYSYQHNRNPFIDHPEYVSLIWENNQGVVSEVTDMGVYPNPASRMIHVNNPNRRDLILYNYMGLPKGYYNNSELDLSEIDSGIYILVMLDTVGHPITSSKILIKSRSVL